MLGFICVTFRGHLFFALTILLYTLNYYATATSYIPKMFHLFTLYQGPFHLPVVENYNLVVVCSLNLVNFLGLSQFQLYLDFSAPHELF